MMEAQDNFKSKPTNIAYLNNATAKTKPSLPRFDDIIESRKQQEDSIMPQETYTKSEIDLKFEKLNSDVQHGFEKVDMIVDNLRQEMRDGFEKVDIKFDQVNQKLDYSINHILSETRNLLLEQQVKEKAEREQERKATNRWLVGIAISLAGLIISIIVNFFLKK